MTTEITVEEAWQLLAGVPDPELPVVSIVDLGIARDVRYVGMRLVVTVTPTYSGCPAFAQIVRDVHEQLASRAPDVEVRTSSTPPWSSDDITAAGRQKLAAAGIAPPAAAGPSNGAAAPPPGSKTLPLLSFGRPAACPRCASAAVEEIAAFGSTACKALWRCTVCREPFDYVKAH